MQLTRKQASMQTIKGVKTEPRNCIFFFFFYLIHVILAWLMKSGLLLAASKLLFKNGWKTKTVGMPLAHYGPFPLHLTRSVCTSRHQNVPKPKCDLFSIVLNFWCAHQYLMRYSFKNSGVIAQWFCHKQCEFILRILCFFKPFHFLSP